MLKILLILCNCAIILLPTTLFAQGENNVLLEKPYFTIYLEAADAYAVIEFNRQRISVEKRLPTAIELPVNHLIKAGENELSFVSIADDKKNKKYLDNTKVKMTLRVRPSGSDPSRNFTLATLEFSGAKAKAGKGIEGNSPAGRLNSRKDFIADSNGDIAVSAVGIEDYRKKGDTVSRKITLPAIGLPRWAFFDSDNITNIKSDDIDADFGDDRHEQLTGELLPIYASIWNALQAKNIEPILFLFDERNKEYDAAFYREPGTTAKKLANSLRKSATEPDRKLFPITSDNTRSQVYDNDKMARLRMNSHDGLIGLNFVGGGSESYDIILRKKNGRWIITR